MIIPISKIRPFPPWPFGKRWIRKGRTPWALPSATYPLIPSFSRQIEGGTDFNPWASELYSIVFSRQYPLSLALFYILILAFSHTRKNLKDQIGGQGSCQVFADSGIKKRHAQDNNIHIFFSCKKSPFLQYFMIVSTKSVYALDIKNIPFSILAFILMYSGL